MLSILFLLLLAIPIVELYVIVQVAEGIGVLPAIVLLLVVSAAGAWLLKQQGIATWRRLQETLQAGRMPANEVADGALILLGGALLLTPGFVTDAVGLVFLMPPSRAALKGGARKLLGRWAERRFGAGRRIYSATVTRSQRDEQRPSPSPPHEDARSLPTEDDSRDRA